MSKAEKKQEIYGDLTVLKQALDSDKEILRAALESDYEVIDAVKKEILEISDIIGKMVERLVENGILSEEDIKAIFKKQIEEEKKGE